MQGFNMGRYYPPDASNAPTFNASSHPLGKRANKIAQGVLTVRFELPFAVWCDHCSPPAIVGQGVRFNAEKKKVGNYHSTPIWSFRMKHTACGGWWEIRTDPKNTEYVVSQGARKRDYGPDHGGAEADGDLKFLTEEEKERRRNDAFANLEGKLEDRGVERENRKRIEEIYDKSEIWRDPYDVNARLRKEFREKRKVWNREDRHKESMQHKFSLGIEIEDETDADRVRAGLVEFGHSGTRQLDNAASAWRPLFQGKSLPDQVDVGSGPKKLKSEVKAAMSRQTLQQALIGNTKAAVDPFLVSRVGPNAKPSFAMLKRKRLDSTSAGGVTEFDGSSTVASRGVTALVEYESD
ncbi:Protein saf4 [Pleosporales sp. CAS-2024a]